MNNHQHLKIPTAAPINGPLIPPGKKCTSVQRLPTSIGWGVVRSLTALQQNEAGDGHFQTVWQSSKTWTVKSHYPLVMTVTWLVKIAIHSEFSHETW